MSMKGHHVYKNHQRRRPDNPDHRYYHHTRVGNPAIHRCLVARCFSAFCILTQPPSEIPKAYAPLTRRMSFFFRRKNNGYNKKYSSRRKNPMKTIQNRLANYSLNSVVKHLEFANKHSVPLAIARTLLTTVVWWAVIIVGLKIIF